MKHLDVFSLLFWIINAWIVLVIAKWGARLLLREVGVDLVALSRRLRRRTKAFAGPIVRRTAYFVGSVDDARHEIVIAADEREAKSIAAKVLSIPEGHLTVTSVHEAVVAGPPGEGTPSSPEPDTTSVEAGGTA